MQWDLNVAWFLYLWALAIADIRNLSVSKPCLVYGGILAGVSIYVEAPPMVDVLIGVIVGGGFLLLSRLTHEALGYGDSMMIAIVSIRYGGYSAIYILTGAFALAAICGGIRGWRSPSGTKEIPFLPFLAMSCSVAMVL